MKTAFVLLLITASMFFLNACSSTDSVENTDIKPPEVPNMHNTGGPFMNPNTGSTQKVKQ